MNDEPTIDPLDLINLREAGFNFCRQNLAELCEEIKEWHDTAVLRDGKLRILANEYYHFAKEHKLGVAEEAVKIIAMEFVLKTHLAT